MLARLKTAHAELLTAIAELEAETRRPVPVEATLSAARLKLTRASSRRKALIEHTILPALHGLSAEDARRIDDLRRRSAEIAVESSRHIGSWTMHAILADWAGYRRASRLMRTAMLQRIAEENEVLYPLLGGRPDAPPTRTGLSARQASMPF